MHLSLLTISMGGSTRGVLDPIAAIKSHEWILRDMDLGELTGFVYFLSSQYHSYGLRIVQARSSFNRIQNYAFAGRATDLERSGL